MNGLVLSNANCCLLRVNTQGIHAMTLGGHTHVYKRRTGCVQHGHIMVTNDYVTLQLCIYVHDIVH